MNIEGSKVGRCRKRIAFLLIVCCSISALAGCNLQKEADVKFGDQNFKSAIALIELHKVRSGSYPNNLREIKFMSEWDQIWLNAVEYTKLEDGYELNVTRGWVGAPELNYPPEFWNGLGLKRSNVKPTQ